MNEASEIITEFICCATENKHIVSVPFIQECGKYACEKCINGLNEFYCYSCKKYHKCLKIHTSQFILNSLKKYLNEFNVLLENKAQYEELKENFNVEYLNQEFEKNIDLIMDEMDLRVESLKAKLDEFRDFFQKKLEKIKKSVKEKIISYNQCFSRDFKDDSPNNFSNLDAKIKQLKRDINQVKNILPRVSFKTSSFEIESYIIGDLRIKEDDIQIFNYENYSGNMVIPLSLNKIVTPSLNSSCFGIYDLESKSFIKHLRGHEQAVTCFTLTLNNFLASGSYDKSIKIWDIDSYNCIGTLKGHENYVNCLKSLPLNKLASGSEDKTIKIWSIDTLKCVYTIKEILSPVSCLEYSFNNYLLSSSTDTIISIWNLNDFNLISRLKGHSRVIECLKILPNNYLASGSDDNAIRIWNLNDFSLSRILRGHLNGIKCMIILQNKKLASGSSETIKIWNLSDFSCISSLALNSGDIFCLINSMENKLICLDGTFKGSRKINYRVWCIDSFSCLKNFEIQ